MNQRARRHAVSVSLFPFLAVLICIMGALVILLVLMVARVGAGVHTVAAARQQAGAAGSGADEKQLRERLEDAQWRREVLEQSRAERAQELAAKRDELAHLEDHIQRLQGQARELVERARKIDQGKQLRDGDLATARQELTRVQNEVAQKKKELEEKQKQKSGEKWYALIPYDGPHGTRRRPIYIECTDIGIVLQPEGVVLLPDDFRGPMGPGNPLDAALRAIRERLAQEGGKAGEPYPLLVVRPSGVAAYGKARQALKAWDDEFGYELISDDKQLAFGEADPALSKELERTIAVARQRQAVLVAAMPRKFHGSMPLSSFTEEMGDEAPPGSFGNGGGGAAGGFGGGAGTGSAGTGTGIGTARGGANGRTGIGAGNGGLALPGTSGSGSTGNGGNGGPYLGAASASGGGGSSGGVGGRFSGATPNGFAEDAVAGGSTAAGGYAGGGFPAQGSGSGTGRSGGSGQAGAGTAGGVANAGGTAGSGGGGQPGGGGGSPMRPGAMSFGGLPVAGSGSGDNSAGGMPGQGASQPTGGVAADYSPSGSARGGSAPAGKGSPGSGRGGSTGSGGSASGRVASGKNRGSNWGLPAARTHVTGVTRPIHVVVLPDRLVLLPEKGDDRPPQTLPVSEQLRPGEADALVAAVQREMKGWGLAVQNGYWRPQLLLDVAPNAEHHAHDLATALEGSGFDLQRKLR
jgi:hypothetical protein